LQYFVLTLFATTTRYSAAPNLDAATEKQKRPWLVRVFTRRCRNLGRLKPKGDLESQNHQRRQWARDPASFCAFLMAFAIL